MNQVFAFNEGIVSINLVRETVTFGHEPDPPVQLHHLLTTHSASLGLIDDRGAKTSPLINFSLIA